MSRRPRSTLARLPGTVVALGVVSLLTDLSSEMIYPLLPLFLTGVLGAGAVALGVIEGAAEATAALLRLVSGVWSDRVRRRKPLVVAGYALAGLARPLIGLAASWLQVLALRFTDRIGKGLRGSPRDALIADVTDPGQRGRAFGLQRGLDHAGAAIGPLVAAALLTLPGVSLREVFLLAAIPAAASLLLLVMAVREPARPAAASGARPAARFEAPRLGSLPSPFRRLLLAIGVFTLGNSTDAFLLLRLSDAGLGAAWVAVLWSAHHLVKTAAAFAGGRLSDRRGSRPMMLAGWGLYALVYLAFAGARGPAELIVVFLVYGLYYGLTEPAERAWVVELVPSTLRGSAFGAYHAVTGLAALPASLLFGLLYARFGAPTAFLTGAVLAALAALLLARVPAREDGPA